RARLGAREGEQPIEPSSALAQMGALLPVTPQGEAQPEAGFHLACIQCPPQRGPEVVEILSQAIARLRTSRQVRCSSLGDIGEVESVPACELSGLACGLQLLGREFANCLEQLEAGFIAVRLGTTQETLLNQRRQSVQGVDAQLSGAADRLDRVE